MTDDDMAEWWKNAFANIPEENIIRLPEEAWNQLQEMLDRPPQPNDKLTELLKRGNPREENRDGS